VSFNIKKASGWFVKGFAADKLNPTADFVEFGVCGPAEILTKLKP
jgi:hypothetical protein